MVKEYRQCPVCDSYVAVINGKIARHEKGLSYVPYRLYHKIEKISGSSVKQQAKNNLCKASGRDFNA